MHTKGNIQQQERIMEGRRIAIGADHAGVDLKTFLIEKLKQGGHMPHDLGPDGSTRVDYPDYASKVARAVQSGEADEGILVCGTGIGMSMAANKVVGIRAALVHDPFTSRMARMHNNANVLVLGARLLAKEYAWECVQEWINNDFEERHQTRLNKISDLETSR
jgi:ribose 5-phosphate isomerase B